MTTRDPIEIWGGLECTIARIGDRYRDQVAETGHRDRIDDLDRVAELGIRTLRYPILWEALSPDVSGARDWSWHDARLARLRELGIRPVAGLIHHGSGPPSTSLLDPDFPRRLALHAGAVARRYPWIDLYTPVNEPLTTARFSALYGHWYPHARDYAAFLHALVHQCRATVLAMRAIRRINPAAKLVQTDDMGRTFSTPALAYQAEHENGRRWLTFDLLLGRVDRHHPWWRIFRDHGVSARDLAFFHEGDCGPDIIGINHYLTSERFLDDRAESYPHDLVGGNGHEVYADVEAVRVPLPEADLGPAARLREVWDRYRRPIAVTEVHHGCTRDEQLRWLSETWRAAETVRAEGADIRAVTIWALFGTSDWNTLLTRDGRIYEPGAFDIRGPRPRKTAIAAATKALAGHGAFDHPVLDTPGWWRRPSRHYQMPDRFSRPKPAADCARSVLIVDDGSALGSAFVRLADIRGLACRVVAPGRLPDLSLADGPGTWAVIDLASADQPDRAQAAGRFRDGCGRNGVAYLAMSGAGVFGKELGRPALEDDPVSAKDATGRDAIARERDILRRCPHALIVRAGPLFGPWDRSNLIWRLLADLSAGARPDDLRHEIVSPSYIPDLVHVSLDLLIDGESGTRHLASSGTVHLHELARDLARRAGLDMPDFGEGAGPILNSALDTNRGQLMPPFTSALDRFMRDGDGGWRNDPAVFRIAAE